MPLETLILTLVAVLSGAFISLQSPINASLAAGLGHPIAAATVSFSVGMAVLLVLVALFPGARVDIAMLQRLSPLFILGGGLLGALFVTSNIMLTPRIGIAAVIALGIAGQMLTSLALDHYGLLGLAERGLSSGRIAGAGLVVAGALMVRFL